jgi:hypothetical protein
MSLRDLELERTTDEVRYKTMRLRRRLKRLTVIPSTTRDGYRLVAGAKSFLAGGYELHLYEHDENIPGWTRLNCLAHGTLGRLGRMARGANIRVIPFLCEMDSETAWKVAQSVIAADVIELVMGSAKLLQRLQSRLLIPLEFFLMDEDNVTPLEMVVVARSLLRSEIS